MANYYPGDVIKILAHKVQLESASLCKTLYFSIYLDFKSYFYLLIIIIAKM